MDWVALSVEIKSNRVIKLIRKAKKHAYKLHMIQNKRYYVIRMSTKSALNIPNGLHSGKFVKDNNTCVVLSSAQAQELVRLKAINRILWSRRFNIPDIHIIDGEFNLQTAMDAAYIRKSWQ